MLDGTALFDPARVFVGITPTGWTNEEYPILGDEIYFGKWVREMAIAGYKG